MEKVELKVREKIVRGVFSRKSERGILMIHGFRSDKNEGGRFERLESALLTANISVLRIDCRGSGESDGDFFDVTIESEVEDAMAGIAFLKNQGVKSIGLIGHSMGGEVSIIAASKEKDVLALGLTSPVLSSKIFVDKFSQDMKDVGNKYEYTRGNGKRGLIGKALVDESQKLRVEDIVRTLNIPLLILHGELDKTIPIHYSKTLADSQNNVSLIMLPNEHHNFSEVGTADVADILSKWFNYCFDGGS